jgi:thiamine biosynthesis protein ThiI
VSRTGLTPCVIVHYHDISRKLGNRPLFLRRLQENLARGERPRARSGHPAAGRIVMDRERNSHPQAVRERLDRVCGIANTALAVRTGSSLDNIKAAVDQVIDGQSFSSFRITARRAFKTFPLTSTDLNRELGAHVLARRPESRVDLHHAGLNVHVEVLPHEAFIYPDRRPGPGGLPVAWRHGGGAHLRGIDSPVASWRMIARGCRVLHPLPQRPVPARRVDPQVGSRSGARRSGSTSGTSTSSHSEKSSGKSCCRSYPRPA